MVQAVWKTVWQFLTKLGILLPYDPEILLLDIYPKEMKTVVHQKLCTGMFIAALFIINKTGGETKMSFTGWWINKLRSIQATEYYLVIKWNELSSHEKTGKNLKCMLLSERSNLKGLHSVWFQLYDTLEKAKIWRQQKDQSF